MKSPELNPIEEPGAEQETFQPQIIFDFIRHGQAEYGQETKDKLEKLGYKWEKVLPSSRVSDQILSKPINQEGLITNEGETQLREAAKALVGRIDRDHEILMLLHSPRFRTYDSARILFDELHQNGVDISKVRQQKNLTDTQKHWLSILEFVRNLPGQPGEESPWSYWLKSSDVDLHEAGLEGAVDVGMRMSLFIKIIERYVQYNHDLLGLERKRLRVIAVTHDINIMALLQEQGIDPGEIDNIKNAQFVEIGVDEQGKTKLI